MSPRGCEGEGEGVDVGNERKYSHPQPTPTHSLFPFLFPLQQAIETSNARFSSGVVALQASTNWTLMCPIHTERRSKLFRPLFKVSIVCPCVTTLYVMRQNFDTSSR
jgi:hypothetical protein